MLKTKLSINQKVNFKKVIRYYIKNCRKLKTCFKCKIHNLKDIWILNRKMSISVQISTVIN